MTQFKTNTLWQSSALIAALALTLSACQKQPEAVVVTPPASAPVVVTPQPTTPGEKLDNAIAKTDATVESAKDSVAQTSAEVKADASAALSNAGEALKEAGSDAKAALQSAGADAKAALQSAGSAIGQAADDASITGLVKTQLARDAEISALNINVDTKDGSVTLNGTAPSATAKARAEELAKGVQGVKGVTNNLSVAAK